MCYVRLQVCHQVAVTWHSGPGAAVVAAAFGVISLPAIVYQPPNCAEREKPRDDCQWVPARALLWTSPLAPADVSPDLLRTRLLCHPEFGLQSQTHQ
jgi:hypothetical protein